MALLVKICGLRTEAALDAALDAGADLLGFVFFPKSPRHLTHHEAEPLGTRVRGRAGKVALFVDPTDEDIATAVDALSPDALQLHGHETPERVRAIKQRFSLPVTKAIAIGARDDLDGIDKYAGAADRLLFDARPPRDATRPGGLGRAFDWTLLRDVRTPAPFLLSGGLDPHNVADAIRILNPGGVDVSSGVERAPGEKDPDLIRDFIRAARAAVTPARAYASAS